MSEDQFHPEEQETASGFMPGVPDAIPLSPSAVVAIGGSAGALDGYERFFLGLPATSGLAFVVVPHLDPKRRGLMPDILKRCTSMPVVQIEEGMTLQADRVHVIPPGHSLSVVGSVLHLGDPEEAAGMVIDTFFEALAADQRERAVGIVLSGMGNDGTRGIQAIKKQGGKVLVQNPETAEYASMPSSAAATHLADDVLPAEELAERLLRLTELTRLLNIETMTIDGGQTSAPLQKILRLVQARTGHDFARYKRTTLIRRIERRMLSHRVQNIAQYVQLLEERPGEVEALFQDFTINVTSFFRDLEAFEDLKHHLRLYIRDHKQQHDVLRVWVAACSTGEEAYSVAIMLHELLEELGDDHSLKVQIFATDIDRAAIDRARRGLYSKDIAFVVSPERLSRYFFLKADQYQVRADLRDSVIFATHSTYGDPPFTQLDLLCCRNMLIYVGHVLQSQMLALFRYALKPHGILFLGSSETVGTERDHFETLNQRWKLYQRGEGTATLPQASHGLILSELGQDASHRERQPTRSVGGRPDPSVQAQLLLLAEYAPPSVVVNEWGEVLFVHGRTARYLELQPGKGLNNIFEMAQGDLRYEVPAAVRQALTEGRRVIHSGLHVEVEGVTRTLDLTVHPLQGSGSPLALVSFQERPESQEQTVTAFPKKTDRALALELELQRARESLQAMMEEMAITVEEVRSTNEELQSANEELQSTNEELMTSKEELQSVNEELNTINAEHQATIRDLAQANDDTRYLLEGAGTAIVFLDNDLNVRRFTPRINRIIRLNPVDVGRPLTDFHIDLRHEQLLDNVRHVLETLEPFEAQVQTFGDRQTPEGQWYLMRISPYRTTNNYIGGAVLAFTNIDLIKSAN